MEFLQKNFPYLIAKGVCWHTFNFKLPSFTIPLSVMLSLMSIFILTDYVEAWWYAPFWMVILMVAVYVFDFAMAIILTGRLKGMAWEFRSDKAAIWIANLIGALLVVGILHFIPLAAKELLRSVHIEVSEVRAVYYTLLGTAWFAYVGIVVSNFLSGISNAARAGVLTQGVADYVIKKFDTYKPSVFDDKIDIPK